MHIKCIKEHYHINYDYIKRGDLLFKSTTFSILEWLIFLIILPIPGINISLIIFLLYRFGFLFVIKKVLIALLIYLVLTFGALSLLGLDI